MVSNMVLHIVLFELIHCDQYHHYLGKARFEFVLPDNFVDLNACFRDTAINIYTS